MSISFTVNGVETNVRNVRGSMVINGRRSIQADILDARASFGDDIELSQDSGVVFAGSIESAQESSISGEPIPDYKTSISCVDQMGYADRRYVSDYFPSQTMLARLTAICTTYLSAYGISVDGGNITGPTLEARAYDHVRLSDVLSDVAKMSGDLVWEIDESLVLRMYEQSGGSPAPFNIIDGDGNNFGDITVETARTNYHNRVIVKAGTAKTVEKTDTFTADGVHAGYTLTYQMVYTPFVGRGYVTRNGTEFEALDLAGSGARWIYDPTFNTITRVVPGTATPAPAPSTQPIVIVYDAQFPIYVSAFDGAEETAHGIWEALIEREDVFDVTEAQAIADQELALGLLTTQTIRYTTRLPGLRPGMVQTIQVADRDIDAIAIITEIAISTEMEAQSLVYAVTAMVTGALQSWQSAYQDDGGQSLAGGGGVVGGSISNGGFSGELPIVDALPESTNYAISSRSGPGITFNRLKSLTYGGGYGWGVTIGQDALGRWFGLGNANSDEWAFKIYASLAGADFALCPPAGGSLTHVLGYPASSATRWKALHIQRAAIFESGASVGLGDWTTYSPSLVAAGGTPAVGTGGSISGRYTRIGKTSLVYAKVTLGTGFSFGTGACGVSLPNAGNASNRGSWTAFATDTGTAGYPLIGIGVSIGGALAAAFQQWASPLAGITTTAPFTFASGDVLEIMGSYEES